MRLFSSEFCTALCVVAAVAAVMADLKPRLRGGRKVAAASLEDAAAVAGDVADSKAERAGKVFSLFNIIQFNNVGCSSQSTTTSGGNRNGTCFTNSECSNKGGTVSGNCASGFGVCCLFLTSTSGSTINQNCTYIRNDGYPTAFSDTTDVTHTIAKVADNVCRLRLDFETFVILGTGNSVEVDAEAEETGGVCDDTFDVTTNTGQRIPQICGSNTGQHLYIDIGRASSDTVDLDFTFTGTDDSRLWEIKVTQIPCYGECSKSYNPPEGCLQWHTGLTGRLETFNFDDTDDNHLQNQDYSICIRQEEDFCCIRYTPCSDDSSFSLDTMGAGTMAAATDSQCTLDYIGIPGSHATCNQGGSHVPVTDKYCGPSLSYTDGSSEDSTICDCTKPFIIDVFTDSLDDVGNSGASGVVNTIQSRGTCLTYMQIACT